MPRNLLTEFFLHFWMSNNPKTKLIKIHKSLDSSRPHEKLLEHPKTWGSMELPLLEIDFKSCSIVIPENGWKTENYGF